MEVRRDRRRHRHGQGHRSWLRQLLPADLTNVNGTLYFAATDGAHGVELWKSDGTAAGTVMVKDIDPGASGSFPAHLTNVNGTLYFAANDGTHGEELWKSDGTAAGTVMVKDIVPGSEVLAFRLGGCQRRRSNSIAFDGPTLGLFRSDGTAAGTIELATNVQGDAARRDLPPNGDDFSDILWQNTSADRPRSGR